MSHRHSEAWLAAALAALAWGCGGAIPRTHYYVIDLPAAAPVARDPASYSAVIMPFRAPEQLEQDRIVYRESPVEVDFYQYHRWADRPAELLTATLAERLRAQRLFSSVSIFDGRTRADYIIRGRLERLEEVDSPGSVAARVEMAVEVVDSKTNRSIWAGSASHSSPVTVGEVKAVVSELSRGVENCLQQIMAGLEAFAKSLPPVPVPASSGPR